MTEEKRLIQNGFSSVETKTEELLETLKKNRSKHIEEYKEALKVYEDARLAYVKEFQVQFKKKIIDAKKRLDKKLKEINTATEKAEKTYKDGKLMDLSEIRSEFNLNIDPAVKFIATMPESHEKDYDRVIKMLEMSTAEFVYLQESEFNQYVLDNWTWKQTFTYNNNNILYGYSLTGNNYYTANLASGCCSIGTGTSTVGEIYGK